jgi:hypothetical protein
MSRELFEQEAEIVYQELLSELATDMAIIKSTQFDIVCSISAAGSYAIRCTLDNITSPDVETHNLPVFKGNQKLCVTATVKPPLLEAADVFLEGGCPLKSKYYKKFYTSSKDESITFVYEASFLDFPTIKQFNVDMKDILSLIPVNPMEARELVHQVVPKLDNLLASCLNDSRMNFRGSTRQLTKLSHELHQTDVILELLINHESFHKWIAAPGALKQLEEMRMNLQ